MTDDVDFYDVANPRLQAAAVELEEMGLSWGQIVSAFIAKGAALSVNKLDPAHVAEFLRAVADKVEGRDYTPTVDPLN